MSAFPTTTSPMASPTRERPRAQSTMSSETLNESYNGSPKRRRSIKTSLKSRFSFRNKTTLAPLPGEVPLATLRVQVTSCKGLFASDRNGKSDPYVVVKLLQQRQRTPVIKSNLNPKWSSKDATFDFPIYGSILERLTPIIEFVVWDKDLMGKDYLGEVSLQMQDWFKDRNAKSFDDPTNTMRSFDLQSSHRKIPPTGSVQLFIGFAHPMESSRAIDFKTIYAQLFDRVLSISGGMDVLSVPPTQGVGTIGADSNFDDNQLIGADEHGAIPVPQLHRSLSSLSTEEKRRFRVSWAGPGGEFNFAADQDVHGVVLLEISSATDLPKLKNVLTRDGWDNDPFVVISFADKIFRTRVIRHELNPVWEEKLVFRVRKEHLNDPKAQINLSVLDWDKLASNDHVGEATLDLKQLLDDIDWPKPDLKTGLYPDGREVASQMKEFKIPLRPGKDVAVDAKHPPYITIRAKFQPHDAMRQRFWRQHLKQYDTNHTGKVSRREITSLANAINLDLHKDALNEFFVERGAAGPTAEVTVHEMMVFLENAIAGMDLPYPPLSQPIPPVTSDAKSDTASLSDTAVGDSVILSRSREASSDEGYTKPTGPTITFEGPESSTMDDMGQTIPSAETDIRRLVPELRIPSESDLPPRSFNLSPLMEVPTPSTATDTESDADRATIAPTPRSQLRPASIFGRSRQSMGELQKQLSAIFEAHPECHHNELGTPEVPARAIIDILATFSERHGGVTLLNEEEEEQLSIITAANPDIPITPDLIIEFIAKSTGSIPPTPSPPKSRSPAPGSHDGHSSSSDAEMSSQEEDATKKLTREASKGDGMDDSFVSVHSEETQASLASTASLGTSIRGPPSPFDARNRSRPLNNPPPTTWGKRPDSMRRRRSDAGSSSRAMSDSDSPSAGRVSGRARAPSDGAAPGTSVEDTLNPQHTLSQSAFGRNPHSRSVPSLPLPHDASSPFTSPESSMPSSIDSTFLRSGDFPSSLSSYSFARTTSGGKLPLHLSNPTTPPPLPQVVLDESPESSDDDDFEDNTMNLSLIRAAEPVATPTASTLDQVESLQRNNQDLTKKLQETGKNLQQRLADHENELEEYQVRLEEVKEELQNTKREEKELRTKERASSAQLASLETEVSKLQKSLDSSRASYQNIQKQYQEQCTEAEKYRNILRRKDEEFKDNEDEANLHLTEVKKYKQDRESAEAVFLALQADLVAANQIEDEFREQRRQNDVLKETIDRLRFDLDELRITAAAQAAQATQAAANAASTASAKAASSLARELSFKLEAAEAEGDDDESDEGSEEGDGERTEADDDEYMETIITTSRRRKVGGRANKSIVSVNEKPKEYSPAWTQHERSEFTETGVAQTDPEPTAEFAVSGIQTEEIEEVIPEVQEFAIQTDEEATLADSDSNQEEEPEPVASSSTVQPIEPAPSVKGKEREIDVRMPLNYDTDEPPSYSRLHVEDDEGTVAYAEDYLRKWHPGLRSIGGVMGGLRPDASRSWRNFKKEINFECLVIEKVVQASSTASDQDEELEALDEDDDHDEWVPEAPSLVAYPAMLILGFGVVIFLSASRLVFPAYGTHGLTYTDRKLWSAYNTLSAANFEGVIRRPPFARSTIEKIWVNLFGVVAGMPEARIPT